MRRDSRLSGILDVLLHMAEVPGPLTSEALASAMQTDPAAVRRTMAGLHEAGFVRSRSSPGKFPVIAIAPPVSVRAERRHWISLRASPDDPEGPAGTADFRPAIGRHWISFRAPFLSGNGLQR